MISDKVAVTGSLDIILFDSVGDVKIKLQKHNLVVDSGLEFICSRMVSSSDAAMSHMGVGSNSSTPTSADSSLQAQVGTRASLDITNASGATVVYRGVFGSSQSVGTLREAGIFNAASGGTMLCRAVFPAIEKSSDDTLVIRWTISIS